LHGGNWRTIDDGRINIAQHDNVECASGGVAEIVLHDASDSVRADGERRSGYGRANQIGDDAGTSVAHDWQRIRDICEARSRHRRKACLHDDVGRADDVETRTVCSSDTAKRDGLSAKVHDAANLTDPLRGDRGPISDKERTKNCDRARATRWNVRPTRRAIETPVGGIAGRELISGTDERKAIRGDADIVHQITSVSGEAWKIRQSKCDGRAARHGCTGWRKLRACVASRSNTRKPTIRHHKAEIRNRPGATAGEQHGLSLETRAIQKRLRLGRC
jgi:hypothetical protein